MTCGECPYFNNGQPLKEGQHFGICPHRKNAVRMWVRADQSACARFSDRTPARVPKTTLSRPLWHLVGAPSVIGRTCIVCGRPSTNQHHVIRRGDGGFIEGEGIERPTVPLCGSGTTGCHGEVHAGRLHIDWRDGAWHWLRTEEPTGQVAALGLEGWTECNR